MKMHLILALIMLSISISAGVPESLVIGPYEISFDLKTSHVTETNAPVNRETLSGLNTTKYTIFLNNSVNIAIITVTDYHEVRIDASNEYQKEILEEYYKNKGITGFHALERTIDNQPGLVGQIDTPDYPTVYIAEYWPDYSPTNKSGSVGCSIFSMYPLDKGTLDLIKTIHIELPEKEA